MPIYEYQCNVCGARQARRRALSDTSPPRCTGCGSGDLVRLVSVFSVVASCRDRTRDVSWIDRDLASRLERKAGGKLSQDLAASLERMKSC
jgi:putative FmdB family regulatory protein